MIAWYRSVAYSSCIYFCVVFLGAYSQIDERATANRMDGSKLWAVAAQPGTQISHHTLLHTSRVRQISRNNSAVRSRSDIHNFKRISVNIKYFTISCICAQKQYVNFRSRSDRGDSPRDLTHSSLMYVWIHAWCLICVPGGGYTVL